MLLTIAKIFSAFVSEGAVKEMLSDATRKRNTQAEAFYLEIASFNKLATETRDDSIKHYVVSSATPFVMDKLKTQKGKMLFVEYGQVKVEGLYKYVQLAITLSSPYNAAMTDNAAHLQQINSYPEELLQMVEAIDRHKLPKDLCVEVDRVGQLTLQPIEPTQYFENIGFTLFCTLRMS